jgi:hypothetical protein
MRVMRGSIFRLTLVLFALRALLPTGFMPDLGAIGHGAIELVLCTAGSDAPVQPAREGGGGSPQKSAGFDCPFGTVLAKVFVAPVAVVADATPAAYDLPVPRRAADLTPPLQGPPLGSRAPPLA